MSSKDREAFLHAAAYMSALRGTDGTGFCVANAKDSQIYKDPIATWNFIQTYQYQSVLRALANNNIVLGHSRSKTVGPASYSNTHPFRSDNITLAHNGTLERAYQLPTHVHGTTDSELIALNMSKLGEKETLELLEGSFALTWYNQDKGTFNIARNDARTLYTAVDTDKQALYYMSDPEMLRFSLYHAGIKVDPKFGLRSAASGVWYVFTDTASKWQEQKFTIKKPEEIKHTYWATPFTKGEDSANNYHRRPTGNVTFLLPPNKKAPDTAKEVIQKSLVFKEGSMVLMEVDDCYTSAKGTTIIGTALIDETIKIIAAKQPMAPEDVGDFYEARVTGKSIKNGAVTLFVNHLLPVAVNEGIPVFVSSIPKKELVCGHCDSPIPDDQKSLVTNIGDCVVGACCKELINN